MKLTVRSFAKLNLDLRVYGKRPDAYHDVRSVYQSIDLHDTLTFIPRDGAFDIRCDDPDVPADSTNLIWKAAAALAGAIGRSGPPTGVAVRVRKRIPAAGGLGGASSNAASALVALSHLWRVPRSLAMMREIAASLGADVPFFLWGGTMLGLGRGDRLFPLVDFPRHWAVIARPPFGVSTPDAYAWFDAAASGHARGAPYLPPDWPATAPVGINDLEAAVAARHPEIGALVDALAKAGAVVAAMSGSGSAAFGLFRSQDAAEHAAKAVRKRRRGTIVFVSAFLTRREFVRASRA